MALAVVALAASSSPASALTGGFDWGVSKQFRTDVYGGTGAPPITASAGATCYPNPDTVRGGCDPRTNRQTDVFAWHIIDANYSMTSYTGTMTGDGTVVFDWPEQSVTVTVDDPIITIAIPEVKLNARVIVDSANPAIPSSDARIDVGLFTQFDPPHLFPETVVWLTSTGLATQAFSDATGGLVPAAVVLDPLSISAERDVPPPVYGTPLASSLITFKDDPNLSKRAFGFRAKDPALVLSDFDPTVGGAYIHAKSSTFNHIYLLPQEGWRKLMSRTTLKGYLYSDPHRDRGPVTSARLQNGKLSVSAKGPNLYDELTDRPESLRVTFQGANHKAVCVGGTGRITYRAGHVYRSVANTAPPDCPQLLNLP